jgi:Core-2/I-Branching enzyme
MSARIAYVVSAYKYPDQLARLLKRLSTPTSSFSLHVDRKTRPSVARAIEALTEDVPRVRFLPRHVSHWGGFGHVRASLKGLADVVEHGVQFDYLVLLTGQDYPLRSAAAIEGFLAEASGRSFMNHWRLPYEPWGKRGGFDRLEDWHLVTFFRRHLALPLRRSLPGGLVPYGGGPYWCLSQDVAEYVYRFIHDHPEYVRFFQHVYIPDELFFQTAVMNSPFRETIVNDNLRFTDWSQKPAPAILREADFPRLVSSGKLFARKFDETVDSTILDLLDQHAREDALAR